MSQAPEKKVNGLPLAAIVCSASLCVPLPSLVGIVLAGVAPSRSSKGGSGDTLAIVALALGGFVIAHVEDGASAAPIPELPGAEHRHDPTPDAIHECRPGTF
jgi:hypothetical protein